MQMAVLSFYVEKAICSQVQASNTVFFFDSYHVSAILPTQDF